MSDKHENITAEDFITGLHIAISYIDDIDERVEMIDYLDAIQHQLKTLEDAYNLSSYEAHRRI